VPALPVETELAEPALDDYCRAVLENVPFNKPCLAGREIEYMAEAIASGHSASGGPFTARAVAELESITGGAGVLLTTSCTAALEMSAMLLGLQPGDVVVVPSFTFTSTATAFARERATLRFCDIESDTLGLDPDDVESVIDDRVKAIVTVHYAGVPSAVDRLALLANTVGAALIEDNAHGLFATDRGRQLGSFGRFSTLSFHETKNFICGEGGALVVNDAADLGTAQVMLDKGTNRKQFLDGLADKYTWQGLGSSFGLSDLLAAFLVAQLEQADTIRRRRRHIAATYRAMLEPIADELAIGLPYEPVTAEPADHMFYVLLPSPDARSTVIDAMRSDGVSPTFHYVPLHSSPAGRTFSDGYRECPVTDDVSGRLLRLPFYNDLLESDIERVVKSFVSAVQAAELVG
jgi:dTDP-4-amino-4,6-dideoxygalactose transaminase